jgi:hypothetical protein
MVRACSARARATGENADDDGAIERPLHVERAAPVRTSASFRHHVAGAAAAAGAAGVKRFTFAART